MQNPWEDSVQVWVPDRRMSHAQPQTRFRNHPEPEHKQLNLQGNQQAPWRNETLKHNDPMMPFSCLSAGCELVYGKYGWPLKYSHEKANKKEE